MQTCSTFAQQVAVKKDGYPLARQVLDDLPDLSPAQGIQGRGELIQEEQPGPGEEGDGQAQALLHALAKSPHPFVFHPD